MSILIDRQGHSVVSTPTVDGRSVVTLAPDANPLSLSLDWNSVERIEIEFPNFTDGRGYSIARQLRSRLGWTGEIRAVGDILVDQLNYLARCGFDRFALREDQSLEAAQRALRAFSASYQATHPVAV